MEIIMADMHMSSDSGPESDEYLVSKSYAWYVFAVLFLLWVSDMADRQIISVLFPFIKAELQVSDTQLGLLHTALTWFMALCVVPAGLLIDRWSRVKSVAIMAVIWSAATAAAMLTTSYIQLLITRIFVGVGEAGYGAGGTPLLAALFPKRMRAFVLACFNAGATVGAVIGMILGGWVATHYGWRHALGLVAVPGFFLGLLMWFTVKDYKVSAKEVIDASTGQARQLSIKEGFKELLKIPAIWGCFFGNGLLLFGNSGMGIWFISYLNRALGMDMVKASGIGGGMAIIAVVSLIGGALLGDKFQPRFKRARPAVCVIGALFAGCITLFAFFGMAPSMAQVGVVTVYNLFGMLFLGNSHAIIQDCVHPSLRGTATSINIAFQTVCFGAASLVVGYFSDIWGLQTALGLTGVFMLLGGLAFFVAYRFYLSDLANVEQVKIEI